MKNYLPVVASCLMLLANTFATKAQIDTVYIEYDSCSVNIIQSNQPNSVYPFAENFAALTWICDSFPCITKTMMNLYLGQVPGNAHILDARMSLYSDHTSGLGFYNHPTYGPANRGTIKRVTEYWNSSAVTWNTQPQTTKINQAYLHSSNSDNQDYPDINITGMVQDMIDISFTLSADFNFYWQGRQLLPAFFISQT